MPSDTPPELMAIVWIYAKMDEPEKEQILDFIRENVKHGTNEGEKEKLGLVLCEGWGKAPRS